jgi:hypothetical protein
MRRALAMTVLLCLFLMAAGNVFGQTGNGQVGGVVQDQSKALVPGVSVTLRNTQTGVTATQVSNESGAYTFASVPPGTYQVTASLPGFKTSITNNVLVGTSAQVRVNVTLEVGAVDSSVEVSITAEQVMTESSASVGDVLAARRVLDLPLVGNDVLDLVKIMPGYRSFPQFNAAGVAVYDVFAGQTSDTVNITRDGLSVNDGRNNPAVFGLSSTTNINPELIGEIRLVLAPVDAELGRGNTQIQIQTRGGTNRYTGSAVWNIQNSALNANTWDNNNDIVNGVWTPTRADWRNTHDLTLTYGGPIVKNKTFFFVAFEQQKSNTRALQTNSVYTDAARQGIFRYWEKWNPDDAAAAMPTFPASLTQGTHPSVDYSGNPLRPTLNPDGTPYNGRLMCFSVFGNIKSNGSPFGQADCPGGTAVVNGSAWDSFRTTMDTTGHIAKILDKMPLANWFGTGDGLNTAGFRWVRGTSGQGGGNAAAGVSEFVDRKQINIKIDQNFQSKHRVSGSWSYQRDDSADFVPAWPGALNGETRRRPHVLTVTGTSTVSASILNEARFGMRYTVGGRFIALESSNASVREAAQEWYMNGGTDASGAIYPVAFSPAGVGNGFINSASQNSGDTTPLYDFADTFSWSRGRHSFKFGGEVRLAHSNGFNSTGGNVIPVATGGASTGLGSILGNTGNSPIFTNQLTGFLNNARAASANLLYFMNASIQSASQLYWIDDASDVTNGTWEDLLSREKKYRDQKSSEWSVFWKDDWKLTKELTLNMGLRYDYYGSPYIGSGFTSAPVGLGAALFGNSRSTTDGLFDRWLTPGNTFLTGYGNQAGTTAANALTCAKGVTQSALLPVSTCDPALLTQIEFVGPNTPNPDKVVIPVDRNNFGPAIGFAWQLPWFGEGKTTVRGGYQITYSAPRTAGGLDAILGSAPGNTLAPTTQVGDAEIAAILATRALNLTDLPKLVPVRATSNPGATVPIYGRSQTFEAYDPNFRTPYIQNITMQVTRSVRRNMTVDVRYVGTFGRKMDHTVNLNQVTVFDNPELFDALEITRAGGNAPLFDLMFAGLDIHGNATQAGVTYGAVGLCVNQPSGSTAPGLGAEGCAANQIRQHGSAHLRRNQSYTANLANGNYVGVINSLAATNTVQSGLQSLPTGLTGVNSRVLRNGCDRLANNQTNIATRCFPEDYFYTNPQLTTASYRANFAHNNYHSMQLQYTLRPTQGTSLQTTYTWSKLLSDRYNTFVDVRDRQADYSMDYAGVPQEIRMNGTFELPIGPNRLLFSNSSGWVARLLENWRTSVVYNWGSGQPRDTFSAQKLYAGGGGNQPQARPDIVGPWVNPKTDFKQNGPNNDTGTIYGFPSPYATFDDPQCLNRVSAVDNMGFSLRESCTLNALALLVPAGTPGAVALVPAGDGTPRFGLPVLQNSLPGTQGTQGARMLRLPGRWFMDANISKSFRLTESKSLQIRLDANNILNHPNPGEPNYDVQSDNFGRITADKVSNTASPRSFQGQVRLTF